MYEADFTSSLPYQRSELVAVSETRADDRSLMFYKTLPMSEVIDSETK